MTAVSQEPEALEFFLLSFACFLFTLAINQWFSHDFFAFGVFGYIPWITCLAGFATGLSSSHDRLFKFAPLSLMATALTIGLFWPFLSTSGFIDQALSQVFSGSDFSTLVPAISLIAFSVLAMLCGPFAFAACVASRIGRLFRHKSAVGPYGTFIAALAIAYLVFQISTAISPSPPFQLAIAASALAFSVTRTLKPSLIRLAYLALSVLIVCLLPRGDVDLSQAAGAAVVERNHWLPYLACTTLIAAIVAWLARSFLFSKDNSAGDWQLLLLGAAFALLICGSLPRLTMLYGNTWYCNAIIFSGIFAIAWLANYAINRPGANKYEIVLYIGMLVSLVISYLLPIKWLLSLGLVGGLLIAFFTLLPLFRVLLMLAVAYSDAKYLNSLMAFTIFGLAAGLLFTGIATYFGQNSLILISLLLFGCSFGFYLKGSKGSHSRVKLATKRIT